MNITLHCRLIDLLLLAFYILVAALIHSYAPRVFSAGMSFGIMIVLIGDKIVDMIRLNTEKGHKP